MSMILDGTITFSDSTVQSSSSNTYSFGLGQTWQSVGASRATGTTYYNTTGKPICVIVTQAVSATSTFTTTVSGVTNTYANSGANQAYVTASFIVIPGGTYSVSAAVNILYWNELR